MRAHPIKSIQPFQMPPKKTPAFAKLNIPFQTLQSQKKNRTTITDIFSNSPSLSFPFPFSLSPSIYTRISKSEKLPPPLPNVLKLHSHEPTPRQIHNPQHKCETRCSHPLDPPPTLNQQDRRRLLLVMTSERSVDAREICGEDGVAGAQVPDESRRAVEV